jgi:hypothetical protein
MKGDGKGGRERERADSPYTATINDFLCFPIMHVLRVIFRTMALTQSQI